MEKILTSLQRYIKKRGNPLNLMGYFFVLKKIKDKLNNIFILILLLLVIILLSIDSSVYASDIRLVKEYASAYAVTGKENGLEGSVKNPATGIKNVHRKVLVNLNQSYAMGIYHGLLGFGYKNNDTLFMSVLLPFTTIGNMDKNEVIDGIPTTTGQYASLHTNPQVSVATRIHDRILIGSSVIGLYDRISDDVGKGISVDTGVLLTGGMLNIGVSVQNIGYRKYWSTGKRDKKPVQINTGVSIRPIRNLEFLSDMSIIKEKMIKNIALSYDLSSYINLTLGIRDVGMSNQFRAGSSMNINSLNMHYSYGHHVVLGDSHKLGMTVGI